MGRSISLKVLMITDVHFGNVIPGYLDSQVECLKKIYNSDNFDHVLILGDVFIKRSPKPKVLLKTQEFLEYISKKSDVTVIKGNHDAETKADDGVTALSLFTTSRVRVFEHIGADNEMVNYPYIKKHFGLSFDVPLGIEILVGDSFGDGEEYFVESANDN